VDNITTVITEMEEHLEPGMVRFGNGGEWANIDVEQLRRWVSLLNEVKKEEK
jgi:hypothetical protein